ncbi:hypothetical protein ACFY2K_36440 [Kitasatospora sp. NPDC001309]|uniref:hypothetical protein n=1 Tax=Kitasatospora sp. NPDC001309 TaxID=3364013 RepID=UPI00369E1416
MASSSRSTIFLLSTPAASILIPVGRAFGIARATALGVEAAEVLVTLGSGGRSITRAFGLADLIDRIVIGAAPPEVEDAVYRLVLEALTNIRRHSSRATRFSVSATRSSVGAVSVSVAHHGGRKALRTRNRTGGGTGLLALAERIQSLAGTVSAGPHQDGWHVRATVPLD